MGKNRIAVAILVVMGVIAVFVLRDRPSPEKEKVVSAIARFSPNEPNEIRLQRAGGEETTGERIVLVKRDDTWRMAEPVDYPVEPNPVKYMAETLGKLKVIDMISDNKEKHGLFGVDDKTGLEVKAFRGERQLVHIIMGKSEKNLTYVRLPKSDAVYRVLGTQRPYFDKSATSLRDDTVIDLEKDDIGTVKFVGNRGELVLAREAGEAQGKLVPVGVKIKNFNESKAKEIWQILSRVRARDFVDSDEPIEKTGLGDQADKVVVELKGSGETETVTLWIGADKEENQGTYLKTSKSEQVFLILTGVANRLRVGADDFARTDEELAKDEEQKKKARSRAAPGGQQIPPEVMRQLKAQMARQQAAPPQ